MLGGVEQQVAYAALHSNVRYVQAFPDFTTLAKRAKTPAVALNASKVKEAVCLVVDSTGLKVYGEGEWKVRKYGWSKRRTWRKLHLAVNDDTQEIEAEVLTDNATDDAAMIDPLLEQTKNRVSKLGRDRKNGSSKNAVIVISQFRYFFTLFRLDDLQEKFIIDAIKVVP